MASTTLIEDLETRWQCQLDRHWVQLGSQCSPLLFQALPAVQVVQFQPDFGLAKIVKLAAGEEYHLQLQNQSMTYWRIPWSQTLLPIQADVITWKECDWQTALLEWSVTWPTGFNPKDHSVSSFLCFISGINTEWMLDHLLHRVTKINLRSQGQHEWKECELKFSLPNPMQHSLFPFFPNTHWGLSRCYELVNYPFLAQFIQLTGLDLIGWNDYPTGFTIQCIIHNKSSGQMRGGDTVMQLNCIPLINLYSMSPDPIHVVPGPTSYPLRLPSPNMAVHRLLSAESVAHLSREKKRFIYPHEIDFLSEPNWQNQAAYRIFMLTDIAETMTLSMRLLVSDNLRHGDDIIAQTTQLQGLSLSLIPLPVRISARGLKKATSLNFIKQLLVNVPLLLKNPQEFFQYLLREPCKVLQSFWATIFSVQVEPLNEIRHGIFATGLQVTIQLSLNESCTIHQIILAWVYMLLLDEHSLVVVKYINQDDVESHFRRDAFAFQCDE